MVDDLLSFHLRFRLRDGVLDLIVRFCPSLPESKKSREISMHFWFLFAPLHAVVRLFDPSLVVNISSGLKAPHLIPPLSDHSMRYGYQFPV